MKMFVVSDSSGDTASRVAQAAIEQFSESIEIRVFPGVSSTSEIDDYISMASQEKAIIVYTLIREDLKNHLCDSAREAGVTIDDPLTPLIVKTGRLFGIRALCQPGHRIDERYFARIDALAFFREHDDGARPQDLGSAQAVLLGLSRSSKSPVCLMLANMGYLVANIPLVIGVAPPVELRQVDPRRVFVLRLSLNQLLDCRLHRIAMLGDESLRSTYADRDSIREELRMLNALIEKNKRWSVLDVTGKAIEETAAEIAQMIHKRFG